MLGSSSFRRSDLQSAASCRHSRHGWYNSHAVVVYKVAIRHQNDARHYRMMTNLHFKSWKKVFLCRDLLNLQLTSFEINSITCFKYVYDLEVYK